MAPGIEPFRKGFAEKQRWKEFGDAISVRTKGVNFMVVDLSLRHFPLIPQQFSSSLPLFPPFAQWFHSSGPEENEKGDSPELGDLLRHNKRFKVNKLGENSTRNFSWFYPLLCEKYFNCDFMQRKIAAICTICMFNWTFYCTQWLFFYSLAVRRLKKIWILIHWNDANPTIKTK